MSLQTRIIEVVSSVNPPPDDAPGGQKKNYTEAISHRISQAIAAELEDRGLKGVRSPGKGRDKQFMGGYGTKGVDAYLSDEKHGLLLTSGVKGLIYDPRKNLKNRYRDMVMEALELHKRFPYAICGHLFFLGKTESQASSKRFGTVLGEAVALLSLISGRRRPEDSPELYETMGIVLLDPGRPESIELSAPDIPDALHAEGYCDRLVELFHGRNPFY